MCQLLYEISKGGLTYRVILNTLHRYLIQEENETGQRRTFRITRGLFEHILAQPEKDRFKTAQSIYHFARLKRESRKENVSAERQAAKEENHDVRQNREV